jgi:hypothetical protein
LKWDINKCSPHIQISADGLTVTKVGGENGWNSAVFGNVPIANTFKIKIVNRGEGNIMVGLASERELNTKGQIYSSNYLIYINNGVFFGINKSSSSLTKIENGAVITMMYDTQRKEVSFSVDNKNFVVGFINVTGQLYPALDISDQGAVVTLVL